MCKNNAILQIFLVCDRVQVLFNFPLIITMSNAVEVCDVAGVTYVEGLEGQDLRPEYNRYVDQVVDRIIECGDQLPQIIIPPDGGLYIYLSVLERLQDRRYQFIDRLDVRFATKGLDGNFYISESSYPSRVPTIVLVLDDIADTLETYQQILIYQEIEYRRLLATNGKSAPVRPRVELWAFSKKVSTLDYVGDHSHQVGQMFVINGSDRFGGNSRVAFTYPDVWVNTTTMNSSHFPPDSITTALERLCYIALTGRPENEIAYRALLASYSFVNDVYNSVELAFLHNVSLYRGLEKVRHLDQIHREVLATILSGGRVIDGVQRTLESV